jgi:dTDP-glucose pyrophosphorylase
VLIAGGLARSRSANGRPPTGPDPLGSGTGRALEITDVNNHFIAEGALEFDIIHGFWGDAGESIDDYYRVNDFVRRYGANK